MDAVDGRASLQPSGQTTQDAALAVVTKRKAWKTLKGRSEVVWPPNVESALIQALEQYRPTTSGDPRLLHRFPKRNQYISDHIFKTTGKRRTAKQVGSRLQQLRDTCGQERILHLLSRREYSPDREPFSEEGLADCLPVELPSVIPSPPAPETTPEIVSPSTNPTNVLVVSRTQSSNTQTSQKMSPPIPSDPHWTYPRSWTRDTPHIIDHLSRPSNLNAHGCHPSGDSRWHQLPPDIRSDDHQRITTITLPLPYTPPTVRVSSSAPLAAGTHRSLYHVFRNGTHVHSEVHLLTPISINSEDCLSFYEVKLVPEYWYELCASSDPTRYTVLQYIVRTHRGAVSSDNPSNITLRSIVYKIKNPIRSTPRSGPRFHLDELELPSGLTEFPRYTPSPRRPLLPSETTPPSPFHSSFQSSPVSDTQATPNNGTDAETYFPPCEYDEMEGRTALQPMDPSFGWYLDNSDGCYAPSLGYPVNSYFP